MVRRFTLGWYHGGPTEVNHSLVGVGQLQVVFLWMESEILIWREGGWKRVKARGLIELGFLGIRGWAVMCWRTGGSMAGGQRNRLLCCGYAYALIVLGAVRQ